MPRKEYSFEVRDWAEDAYIEDGLTFEEASQATGVPAVTLKRWAAEASPTWSQRRKERLEERRTLKESLRKVRLAMMEEALVSKDPQAIFAVIRLEKLARDQVRRTEKGPDIDRPKIFLEDLEFIAQVVGETDPEGLKVLSRNFETIVDRFKERHAQTA